LLRLLAICTDPAQGFVSVAAISRWCASGGSPLARASTLARRCD
jgi:hypothetical protein